jgi:hypothetical protein
MFRLNESARRWSIAGIRRRLSFVSTPWVWAYRPDSRVARLGEHSDLRQQLERLIVETGVSQ